MAWRVCVVYLSALQFRATWLFVPYLYLLFVSLFCWNLRALEKRRLFELISSGYFSARLSTQICPPSAESPATTGAITCCPRPVSPYPVKHYRGFMLSLSRKVCFSSVSKCKRVQIWLVVRIDQGTLILRSDRIYPWRICFITAKSLPLLSEGGRGRQEREPIRGVNSPLESMNRLSPSCLVAKSR